MWYADYKKKPQTPYVFKYWQYSNKVNIPRVIGNTDMNIKIIKNNRRKEDKNEFYQKILFRTNPAINFCIFILMGKYIL